jgi:hypothetical protein
MRQVSAIAQAHALRYRKSCASRASNDEMIRFCDWLYSLILNPWRFNLKTAVDRLLPLAEPDERSEFRTRTPSPFG